MSVSPVFSRSSIRRPGLPVHRTRRPTDDLDRGASPRSRQRSHQSYQASFPEPIGRRCRPDHSIQPGHPRRDASLIKRDTRLIKKNTTFRAGRSAASREVRAGRQLRHAARRDAKEAGSARRSTAAIDRIPLFHFRLGHVVSPRHRYCGCGASRNIPPGSRSLTLGPDPPSPKFETNTARSMPAASGVVAPMRRVPGPR
jgi:hypothetical protein